MKHAYILDRKYFTTRSARGTDFSEGDDHLIRRAMVENQNRHSFARFLSKSTFARRVEVLVKSPFYDRLGGSLRALRVTAVNSSRYPIAICNIEN